MKNPQKTKNEVKILPTSYKNEGKKDQIQDAEIVNPSAHKAMGNLDKSTRETIVATDSVKQPNAAHEVEEEVEDRENEEGRN